MKSQSELLAQISAAGQRQADALSAQQAAAHDRLMARVSAIKALAPRIARLLELGQALWENRLPVSPTSGGAFPKCRFITDGIHHHLGFFVVIQTQWGGWFDRASMRPASIGIEGGGCSGYSLEISADGEILRGMPTRYGSAEGKMVQFLDGFDAFERDYLAYVESLTAAVR